MKSFSWHHNGLVKDTARKEVAYDLTSYEVAQIVISLYSSTVECDVYVQVNAP